MLEEIGNVKSVTSEEARLEGGVQNVVGQIPLEIFTLWVSESEGGWGESGWLKVLSIEEGSVESHGGNSIGGDLDTLAHLGVVEGDTSEVWNNLLVSVQLQVLVDGSGNSGFDGVLKLSDNQWDKGALEEWDEDGSNLSDQSSGECDIDIIWVNINVNFTNCDHWSKLGGWGSRLGSHIELSIKVEFLNDNSSLTADLDKILKGKVSGQGSLNVVGNKLESILRRIKINVDVLGSWLRNFDIDVLQFSTVEINLWEFEILDILEDIWGEDVLSSANSVLADRSSKAWSISGRHSKC